MKRKLFAATLAAVVAVLAAVPAIAGATGPPRPHLISMGDSVAAGQGASNERFLGNAGLFSWYYRVATPGRVRTSNVAVKGETSGSLLGDQWAAAERRIAAGSDVEVVTLTIGANDFLPLLGAEPRASDPAGAACQQEVGAALAGFAGNFQTIMTRLAQALAADPGDEQVIVTTYYNPFDGTGSPYEGAVDAALLGADGVVDCAASGNPLNAGLNDIVACTAEAFGASVADIHPLFDGQAPLLTHIAEGDAHPNNLGHWAIAGALVRAYEGR